MRIFLLSAAMLFALSDCFSQAGKLDPSFGFGGKVYLNILDSINKHDETARAVAIQADGKILVAGTTSGPNAILRYHPNGNPDGSFDGDRLPYCFGMTFTCIAVQDDGKILAAGKIRDAVPTATDFLLVRLESDGSFDHNFGIDGVVITAFGPGLDEATCLAVQGDGKIVLGGFTSNGSDNDFALARYNSNGSPDNSFDGDGIITTAFGAFSESINALSIQSDGKILVAGVRSNGPNGWNGDFALARYNADGSLDNSFDGDGRLTTDITSVGESISCLLIQPDQKILVAGTGGPDVNFRTVIICRYFPNGTLDNSFDGDGIAAINNSFHREIHTLKFQLDGKLVIAGRHSDQFNLHMAVSRLNADGSLDNSFDADGTVVTQVGRSISYAYAVAIHSDGKIVIAGKAEPTGSYDDFAIVRFDSQGSLDNGFDGDGIVTTNFSTSYDMARDIAIQNDGKIVLVGFGGKVEYGHQNQLVLIRYNTNGKLDSNFGQNGKVIMPVGPGGDDLGYAIAIQNDGKIVVGGSTGSGTTASTNFLVARYNIDGTLDNGFDVDGIATADFGTHDYGWSLAIQPDGKIVISGYSGGTNSSKVAIARFNINGILDNSFDGDGKVTFTVGTMGNIGRKIAIQADGKILVAGDYSNPTGSGCFVRRYNSDGTVDMSFNGNGTILTDIAGGLTIQADGKILVTGKGGIDILISRYNIDGSPDVSFDGDGRTAVDIGNDESPTAMTIQANGKIIIVGNHRNANGTTNLVVARVQPTGGLDNSFDGDGWVSIDLTNGGYEYCYATQIHSNHLYLAGETHTEGGMDFLLASVFLEPPQAASLSILEFTGKLVNNDAVITWKTKNESNMLEYIVERSANGNDFTSIGKVRATNAVANSDYSLVDRHVTNLNTPVVYYRLKQKGVDGNYTYSGIVVLPIDKNLVLFYPNPVVNQINLVFTLNQAKRVAIRILDTKGRLLKQQQSQLAAGTNSFSMYTDGLPRGIYFLDIRGEGFRYNREFIK